jgi:hypothetical protein
MVLLKIKKRKLTLPFLKMNSCHNQEVISEKKLQVILKLQQQHNTWKESEIDSEKKKKEQGLKNDQLLTNFSASTGVGTPAKIQRVILEEFVERYKEALVKKNGSGVLVMLLNNNIEELKLVYEVLSLVDGALGPTIEMFKEQALKEGKAIVKDPENDKNPQTLVVQLKELFEFLF